MTNIGLQWNSPYVLKETLESKKVASPAFLKTKMDFVNTTFAYTVSKSPSFSPVAAIVTSVRGAVRRLLRFSS